MSRSRFFSHVLLSLAMLAAVLHVDAPTATATPGDGGPLMYGVYQYGNFNSYGDRGFQPIGGTGEFAEGGKVITMSGHTVESAHAIAVRPPTGAVYAVLELESTSHRVLATFDPDTGVATLIGTTTLQGTPVQVVGLTFDSTGSLLYGVTGDGGGGGNGSGSSSPCQSCLISLNPETGAGTLLKKLDTQVTLTNPDANGEAIAFDPDDDLIYHVSGYDDDRVFQTIDPAAPYASTPIAMTGDHLPEAVQGLAFDPATDTLYATDWNAELFRITEGGASTFVVEMETWLRGLAVVMPEDAVAVDDRRTFAINQGPTFIDVLENDIDGSLTGVSTVTGVSDPPHGTAEIQSGGIGVRYHPDAGTCRNTGDRRDTFSYTINGGSTAFVRIEVPCPVFESSLTLGYNAKRGVFKGVLSSPGFAACAADRQVDIMRVTSAGDEQVATTQTLADGSYKVKKAVRRGTFYADAAFEVVPSQANCSGTESPTIKVK